MRRQFFGQPKTFLIICISRHARELQSLGLLRSDWGMAFAASAHAGATLPASFSPVGHEPRPSKAAVEQPRGFGNIGMSSGGVDVVTAVPPQLSVKLRILWPGYLAFGLSL